MQHHGHGPQHFFANNGVFLTGVTGFVGKVLLEKLLHSAPGPGKIYVLIRPQRDKSATSRLLEMMRNSLCFDRLRNEIGQAQFEKVFQNRVCAVSGDVLSENMGIAPKMLTELRANVQIVCHLAASVDFNMRLDRALDINARAGVRMMNLAKSWGVVSYVHVSTCYVNCNRTMPGQAIVQEKLYTLHQKPEKIIAQLAQFRANSNGVLTELAMDKWKLEIMGSYPNTYTFTKAIGEHLIAKNRETMPLAIVRPSIIGSSWREPFAGWVDNVSAAGAVFLAGGLGILTVLPGNPSNVADLVPVDVVANHCVLAAYNIAGENRLDISHCGTSGTANTLRWRVAADIVRGYFQTHPPKVAYGPSRFQMIKQSQMFQIQWFLRYSVPTAVLGKVAEAVGSAKAQSQALKLRRGVQRCAQVVDLFKHFTINEFFFQNDKSRAMMAALLPEERALFNCDTTELVWSRYLRDFSYGLCRFVLKEDLVPVRSEESTRPMAAHSTRLLDWDADHKAFSYQSLMPDLWWVYTSNRDPGYFKGNSFVGKLMQVTGWKQTQYYPLIKEQSPLTDPKLTVLDTEIVAQALDYVVNNPDGPKQSLEAAKEQAEFYLNRIAADDADGSQRFFGYVLRKILRRLFTGLLVDEHGMAAVRKLKQENKGPVVLLPTHRSYFDFLLLSYVLFGFSLELPYIAAAEDFLAMGPVTKLLRGSRAFFLNRHNFGDTVYRGVLNAYVQELLKANRTVEFFIEGTRSRSGKCLEPKMGFLKCVLEPFISGAVEDIHLVPVMIDYEKIVEIEMFSTELLGQAKRKETFKNLISAVTVLSKKFGHVSIILGEPMSVKNKAAELGLVSGMEPQGLTVPHAEAAPTSASVSPPVPTDTKVPAKTFKAAANSLKNCQLRTAIVDWTTPRLKLVQELAYDVIEVMHWSMVCMPTHLVATLLLQYRHGIAMTELVSKVHWLHEEIHHRGHSVVCVEAEERTALVDNAIFLLGNLVTEVRPGVVAPAILLRQNFKNALALAVLRNKTIHIFAEEGLVLCAVYALQTRDRSSDTTDAAAAFTSESISLQDLVRSTSFVSALMHKEFVRKEVPGRDRYLEALQKLVQKGVLKIDHSVGKGAKDSRVQISNDASTQAICSFLGSLFWPFLESYWVASVALFGLQPDVEIESKALVARMQWLAETMYHERLLNFYESCSMETLGNALAVLKFKGILHKTKSGQISLTKSYRSPKPLQKFVDELGKYRQVVPTLVEVSRARSLAAGMINTFVPARL